MNNSSSNEIFKLNLKIFLYSYILNPGALLVGVALYSILTPNEAIHPLLENRAITYAVFLLGGALMIFNFRQVMSLAKRKKELKD